METDDFIPLSLLSQYGYCPRRAGLIMLDQAWADNEYTAAGQVEHERVHTAGAEKRGVQVKLFDSPVFSATLCLSGRCDLIEAQEAADGCLLPGYAGRYRLNPVEFKHGVVRDEREYHLQLCAQAMCLEEMFDTHIEQGEILFITAHRRDAVAFTDILRKQVVESAHALSRMMVKGSLPPALYGARCRKCSLIEQCRPKMKTSAAAYCRALLASACEAQEES